MSLSLPADAPTLQHAPGRRSDPLLGWRSCQRRPSLRLRETNCIRKGRHPLRPRLAALVEHGQQAGVFDSRIPALAVNDLIDGLMYALIDAVTAGVQAWQLVRRAASQADTQG